MSRLSPVLDQIDATLEDAVQRLFELLVVPSISTDPDFAQDCQKAATLLAEDLKSLGAEACVDQTPGHPMVIGHIPGPAPHLVFYGHYDVQPVDPIELWDNSPFTPQLEDTPNGKVIRARGSSDDKGQLMTFVEACRAWIAKHGALPCGVTFFFEGEEESGSPSLVPYLREKASELQGDIALICDTGLYGHDRPAIITQLRGLLGQEITIKAASKDLHSGMYGGIAANPLKVLSGILAGLHDDQNRVTIPGFYDGVPEVSAEQSAQWDSLKFDAGAFLGEVGLADPAGETDRKPLDMIWARPTCEINGVAGGYAGTGFKTVLPAQANAKISFRLVGNQDPLKIREAFQSQVRAMVPPDCDVIFEDHGAGPAVHMDTSSTFFTKASEALSEEWPEPAAFVGAGGSIPVAGYFKSELDLDAMLIGFARDDDSIHSPNEKYDLESFHKGIRSWARILDAVSD
ncbi:MAG: M20/M25/M40 family metallo-hydrolase [Pseudomonadota bacterium]